MSDTPKRKRRWLQFSLRSLLIFTVLCALAAAWLGRKIERKRQEQVIVDAIRNAGGKVSYDYVENGPSGPVWLRSLLGENFFNEIDEVFLVRAKVGDGATLRDLKDLPKLRALFLSNDVTDAALAHVKRLIQLQILNLDYAQVTDAGVIDLMSLTQLHHLSLRETKVTDACLLSLKGLTRLDSLYLCATQVTDEGMVNLKGLNRLTYLYLSGTRVTDAGMVNRRGLAQLQCLGLRNTRLTDAGLVNFKALTALRTLDLENTQVTDAGLVNLKGLGQLAHLDLKGTLVTNAGAVELRTALPDCQVSIDRRAP